MKTTIGKTIGLALLSTALLAAVPAYGQGSGQGQQNPPQGQSNPPAKPTFSADTAPSPAPVNAEEEAAYKAIFEMKGSDFAKQIQLGEEFLRKFPESRYRESVYSRLTSAYLAANEVDKMMAAGEKALELKNDDVDVLALMALVIPRRANPGAIDGNQKLTKAEGYAKQAIGLLAALPKPANLSDEDFNKARNEKLSMCRSGLGFVYFHRQKYADAASEFEQATKLATSPDPVDFFVLGLSLTQTKRFADAATAFGHCAGAPGVMQARCKQSMDEAKKRAATELSAPR